MQVDAGSAVIGISGDGSRCSLRAPLATTPFAAGFRDMNKNALPVAPSATAFALLAAVVAFAVPVAVLVRTLGAPAQIVFGLAMPWAVAGGFATALTAGARRIPEWWRHADLLRMVAVACWGLAAVAAVGALELWKAR